MSTDDCVAENSPQAEETLSWKETIARHKEPVLRRSAWQLANTLVPYFALWGAMIWTWQYSYWLTLPLAILAAGFLVRIFIIFHDCTHGSYFKSRAANETWGFITGVLTFTPFHQWRKEHSLHHGTSGDLDRRGVGDIWTLTVQEYLSATRWKRFAYRLARNPFILFVLAPFYYFAIQQRLPSRCAGKQERRGVIWTNLALLEVATIMTLTVGFQAYFFIQLTVAMIAAAAGVWLFYVQHQFEGTYWERQEHWDFVDAALKGSSFYRLPKILQWFSGNIGFHHLHHLSPIIPNYNLERCHKEDPTFHEVTPITLWSSLRSLTFRLWDEKQRRLVGYRELKARRRAA